MKGAWAKEGVGIWKIQLSSRVNSGFVVVEYALPFFYTIFRQGTLLSTLFFKNG